MIRRQIYRCAECLKFPKEIANGPVKNSTSHQGSQLLVQDESELEAGKYEILPSSMTFEHSALLKIEDPSVLGIGGLAKGGEGG